jgi:hypothetical protein
MKPVECPFESDVLLAVVQSRFPQRVDPGLQAHVASCPICADVVAVASAFDGAREATLNSAEIPGAGRVWRHAQFRARREAIQTAGRPITAIQVIAFATAMSLLGACFGATSAWFQSALARTAAVWASIDKSAWLASCTAVFSEHAAFVLAMLAVVLLIPTAVFVALGRD